MIRLLIVDDHALFREGLARVLSAQPDFVVVGQAERIADAIAQLPSAQPGIILLDVDLGIERALDFVSQAAAAGFSGRILIVTGGISDGEAVQLVRNGVAGIFHKHNPPDALCYAIRQVSAGDVFLEPRYLKPLFEVVENAASETRPTLTDREVRVLQLLFQGHANKEIGDALDISESLVKAVLRALFDKLGVRTRSQLVRVALEQYRDQL